MTSEVRRAMRGIKKFYPCAVVYQVNGLWEVAISKGNRILLSYEQQDEDAAWLAALETVERLRAIHA